MQIIENEKNKNSLHEVMEVAKKKNYKKVRKTIFSLSFFLNHFFYLKNFFYKSLKRIILNSF